MRYGTIDLRSICPRGGDQRGAFEELSFLLFAREHRPQGVPIRRHGAGGDAGLEGIIADTAGRALVGLQSKFFASELGTTQWRDLDKSVRTALGDNAPDRTLREIVITLPRALTQAQAMKWQSYRDTWDLEAERLGYADTMTFTLWDESRLRDLLLSPQHRGLLLHFFEFPDFDIAHSRERTRLSIAGLGDRYQPDLHTTTSAEDKLHTFLRSERSRQAYLDMAREKLHDHWWLPEPRTDWPTELRAAYERAELQWQNVLRELGDGVSLPASFSTLAESASATASALDAVEEGILPLIPPRERRPEDEFGYPYPRHPNEELLNRVERWAYALRSFASYLREHALADSQCLLFSGEPGTGKTHVLAEVCNRYADEGGVVLFVEGGAFTNNDPVWLQFVNWAGRSSMNLRDFLEALAAMAATTDMPALICVDALNETPNRNLWRLGLEAFASEVRAVPGIKLIVSCRSDYLRQTLPTSIADQSTIGWAFAEHEGLGIDIFKAFPKYIAAYRVRWEGLPPLAPEFQNPLFLRTFCEAYADNAPEPGSLSLATVLKAFAQRKANLLGQRIDCDPAQVLDALRELADAMLTAHALQLPERKARQICETHHTPTESSRSLFSALLSEGVLAEFPGPDDDLGNTSLVRFTYERVWDYFVSVRLLPAGTPPSPALLAQLRDANWRNDNAGVVGMLMIRCAEEGVGELADLVSQGASPPFDVMQFFLESLPWRTKRSVSDRTEQLFREITRLGLVQHELDFLIPLAPNPQHPWNADWLHDRLMRTPLAERDRTWTLWVNEQFLGFDESSPIGELVGWAERARHELLSHEHLLLLATVLAWCASTTVPEARKRLASALTRLVSGRIAVATRLVARFLPIDDSYVRERVLLAAAGAAQHATAGDAGLGQLAQTVHTGIFGGRTVEPHVFIRHYATEVCKQAQAKGVLPPTISPQSFDPPFRSRWPRIWTEARFQREKNAADHATVFASVEPGPGVGYGDWGRYTMSAHIHNFQSRKLRETPATESVSSDFDAQIVKRYVVQRVFELGWDSRALDLHPNRDYATNRNSVERLSKKYQWIALYEFLGLLSDHYHFQDFNSRARPFRSAQQLDMSELLDPFVIDPPPEQNVTSWNFAKPAAPWWRGGLDPLSRPLSAAQQRQISDARESFHPLYLLDLNDGVRRWLTLSAFHVWYEPIPVWHGTHHSPHVGIEWAIQSYLVSPQKAETLINHLNQSGFGHNSQRWLSEPEFSQPLATLRTFPLQQERLRLRCQLDKKWETEDWDTGAYSTTCRCAPDEEQRRALDGSMPSPQLADLGNLRWLGRAFDFAPLGQNEPVVRHVGRGFRGACIAHAGAVQTWIRDADLRLVWRVYGFKYRLYEPHDENHARAYWSTFMLQPDGRLICCGGATCAFPHGPGPDESLPWYSARRQDKRRGRHANVSCQRAHR